VEMKDKGNLFGDDLEDLEFQYTCGVCFEIFEEPITLDCSHNICKDCLVKIYKKNPSCPFCRRPFGLPFPPVNEGLRELALRFLDFIEKRDRGEELSSNYIEQTESFFMSLPEEVMVGIFSYLDVNGLTTMNTVCKQVKPVSDDSWLWRYQVNKTFPFCNANDFGNNWKTCFKANKKLKVGWGSGRSKDFKMTPLRGHTNYINCFDFYRQHVVSGSADNKVILWKVNSTKPLYTITGHNGLITCVKFNEQFIVSGSQDRSAKVWDCSSGLCMSTIYHGDSINSLTYNENTLLTSSQDRTVRRSDLRTGNNIHTYQHNEPVLFVLPGRPGQIITSSRNWINIWDTRFDQVVYQFNLPNIQCIDYVGNDKIAIGNAQGSLTLYNTAYGNLYHQTQLHHGLISCMNTDGKIVVTGSNDNTLKVYDIAKKKNRNPYFSRAFWTCEFCTNR